jgi:hypothetical protein
MDSNIDYVLHYIVSVAFLQWVNPPAKQPYKLSTRFNISVRLLSIERGQKV